MARKGFKKFDELKIDDGRKFPIRVHQESGEFEIDCRVFEDNGRTAGGELFHGTDLEKVKTDATCWLKDNDELPWEPVIVVRRQERASWEKKEHMIQFRYERYYRARRADDTYLWRNVFNRFQSDEPLGKKDEVTREPFDLQASVVLPYTEERWQALRTISKMIETLDKRIQDVVKDASKLDQTLGAIAQRGFMALLPAPEKKP